MKKLLLAVWGLILLVSCSPKESNVSFTGVIESVSESSILVSTSDKVGFDKASVKFDKNLKLNFTPEVGQEVKIEILPQIMESYPVQVTAVKISLKDAPKVEYKKITPAEAKKIIDEEKDVIILDVRTKEEYDQGHIQNAVLISDTQLEKLAPTLLPTKDAKILVYCRSGNRSKASAKKLIEMGYTNVLDFGGINDWSYGTVK